MASPETYLQRRFGLRSANLPNKSFLYKMFSMNFLIRPALQADRQAIIQIHKSLNRPSRRVVVSEYLVAEADGQILGCAAVRILAAEGYLYGLAVRRESQHTG